MSKTTINIDETPAAKGEVTLTIMMRGDVTKVTDALIHGFPKEALQQLADAFGDELRRRSALLR